MKSNCDFKFPHPGQRYSSYCQKLLAWHRQGHFHGTPAAQLDACRPHSSHHITVDHNTHPIVE